MLLVYDDQCQVGNRSEHSRACADDHTRVAALDAVPLLRALFVRERGMQNRHFIAKDVMQISGNRRREPDFRDQENGRAAGVENRAHPGKIHGGLA